MRGAGDGLGRTELLLIGGRSGVGKSTAAAALHWSLSRDGVRHAVVEGDALDLAFPAAAEHRLAEANLAAMWANYRRLGYRRLVYANTNSVLNAAALTAAMGDDPRVVAVLLEADGDAIASRLGGRDAGESLRWHLRRSAEAAEQLDAEAPVGTARVATTGRTPQEVAEEIRGITGW